MRDYSGVHIFTHTWVPVVNLPNGSSQRVWDIKLKLGTAPSKMLTELASIIVQDIVQSVDPTLENDLSIDLDMPNPSRIIAIFTTKRDGYSSELLIATWHMFESLDKMIGTIDTIAGQPRAVWPPWNLQPHQVEDSN